MWGEGKAKYKEKKIATSELGLLSVESSCPSRSDPMALPYFLRNLIPRREKGTSTRSLWAALKTLTWVQWAQFFSGCVACFIRLAVIDLALDDLPRACDWQGLNCGVGLG